MSIRYKKLLTLAKQEAEISSLLEAMPERPLQPGQSARITGKDPQELVRNIRQYISTHKTDLKSIDRLEHQLKYYKDFGLTPEQIEHLKQEINDLKKFRDPKTHGYEKIIDQIVPIIKQRCSKYLPSLLASRFFLHRGLGPNEHKNRLAFRANSRNARRPIDSDPKAQILFDKALQDLNFTALRSNSIFTSGDPEVVKTYGTGYIIFPTNEATFTWSKNRSDLIIRMDELEQCREVDMDLDYAKSLILERIHKLSSDFPSMEIMSSFNEIKRVVNRDIVNPNDVKGIIQNINMKSRTSLRNFDQDLFDFLESLYRISKEDQAKTMRGDFEIDLDKFQKRFDMTNKDFDAALDTGHEILIHGEYIAVLSSFESLLREALTANNTVTEAKIPTLEPGTTKNLPTLSKFGKIYKELDVIRNNLDHIQKFSDASPSPEIHQGYVSKEKKLSKEVSSEKAAKILDYINSNCSNYVAEMKKAGLLLYRGIKSDESKDRIAFIGNSRTDRKPKDSNLGASQEFNQIMTELGIEANRSNSIFTTSDTSRSSIYGDQYIIFPLNSAKFSWTSHPDLILNSYSSNDIWVRYTSGDEEFDNKFKDEIKNNFAKKITDLYDKITQQLRTYTLKSSIPNLEPQVYTIKLYLDNYIYSKYTKYGLLTDIQTFLSALPKEIQNDPELNILSELDNFLNTHLPKFKKVLDLNKFKAYFNPKDTDFAEALESGNEICISGHYIALERNHYKKFIETELLYDKEM